MPARTRFLLLLLVGAGLALGLGLAAQQNTKPPETELERAANRAWQDLEAGQSEPFIASAVQVRVEQLLPPVDDLAGRRRVLLTTLDTQKPAVQWTVLVSLHHYRAVDTPLLRRLIELAESPIRRIRVAAATAIGPMREVDDDGAALLMEAAGSSVTVLRSNALRALARTRGGERLVPVLLSALASDEVAVRRAAAYGIALIDMEPVDGVEPYPFADVVTPLGAALQDEDIEVRQYAAGALSRMGSMSAPVVGKLVAALEEEDRSLRYGAATALANVGAPAIAPLESYIGEASDGGIAGFGALRLIGTAAVPALERLLEHERARTRILAARTLWDMDVDRGRMIERLTATLAFDGGTNKGLWMWDAMLAMEGLSRAGKNARGAAEALRAIAENMELDEGVRNMARDTLASIGDE